MRPVADTGGQARHPAATERLMHYWAEGEGAAKIEWGKPDDFYRCKLHLGKYVHGSKLDGLCSNLHQRALGYRPNQGPHRVKHD